MIIIDSTVLIDVLRDRSGQARRTLEDHLEGRAFRFTRMTEFEVLRGSRDKRQWDRIARHLAAHGFADLGPASWEHAARIAFDLKKAGRTVRSGIDCLIAQVALEHDATVLHNDNDFDVIATVRPLRHTRLDLTSVRGKTSR